MDLVVDHTTRIDLVFDAVEQEWMLADLPELHESIAKTLHATLLPILSSDDRFTQLTHATHPLPFSFPSAIILYFFICL